ncbi:MAG: hypothetical protein ACTHMS_05945, partial [Jatrophihabitans sp.]|uniref:hypothetical protein n=1 Tax=Jatrophihabitans sp. TaxID=1932789 RepID=UPI003F7E6A41
LRDDSGMVALRDDSGMVALRDDSGMVAHYSERSRRRALQRRNSDRVGQGGRPPAHGSPVCAFEDSAMTRKHTTIAPITSNVCTCTRFPDSADRTHRVVVLNASYA